MKHYIVGFTGTAGSGKDTAAEILVKKGWVRFGFADVLKNFCASKLSLDPNLFFDVELKDKRFDTLFSLTRRKTLEMITTLGGSTKDLANIPTIKVFDTPREILQYIGTDIGRKLIGENVWVDYFQKMNKPEKVVVTDIRFPNEVVAVQAMGGIVIKLLRKAAKHKSVKLHESESMIESLEVDHEIHNTTTKEYLHNMVLNILDNEGWI